VACDCGRPDCPERHGIKLRPRVPTDLESERVMHNHFAVAMEHRSLNAESQRDELLAALKRIVDEGGCTCTGYYKCGGCPERAIYIAEAAIAKAEGK
jgi:hypothetical protein